MNTILRVSTAIVMALYLSACDNIQVAPKIIRADGVSYLSCKGLIWVDKTSGMFSSDTAFKIAFTDSGNMSRSIWGIKSLSISDPQAYEIAPFPNHIPDPKLEVDINGKPYVNGNIYTWPDGSKAELVSGKWKPVPVARACK
jgi:hypothetical protein